MKNLQLSPFEKNDIDEMVAAFNSIGWNKPKSLYEKYLYEQNTGVRSIILAKVNEKFVGYVTLKWESDYPEFSVNNIPEISDLNVLSVMQKNGIGTMLIEACENMARERQYAKIGLGVGLTADYGNAQRLYCHLGYVPDGHGLCYKNKTLAYADNTIVDDDLVLYLTKEIA